MTKVIEVVVLGLVYQNKLGFKLEQAVAITNDVGKTHSEVVAMFSSLADDFHAERFGLPNPAHFKFDWQEDGVNSCNVQIKNIHAPKSIDADLVGREVKQGFTPSGGTLPMIDVWSDIPLSAIEENIKAGTCDDYERESMNALTAEQDRLTKLLGKGDQQIVILVGEYGKIDAVITESDDLDLNCLVVDKNSDAITEDVACDWHGDHAWFYSLSSYAGKDKINHVDVVDRLFKNYGALTKFAVKDGYLEVSDETGEYLERERIPVDMSEEAQTNLVNYLNTFNWPN